MMVHTPWSLRWGLCVVGDCIPEDEAHQVYDIYVYVHNTHTDRTHSHHLRQQSAIPILQLWSESCCKRTVPNGPWWHTRCNMCPDFFPGMLLRRPLLQAQCVDLDVRPYYVAVQNLVYACGNVPQSTIETSDTPPIYSAQHVKQSFDMSIQLPTGLDCDPVQMAEVIQREYLLVCGAWLYPRVNVANTLHLLNYHS